VAFIVVPLLLLLALTANGICEDAILCAGIDSWIS
jgi:hypothetical protein